MKTLTKYVVCFKSRTGEYKFMKPNADVVKFSTKLLYDELKYAEKCVRGLDFLENRMKNVEVYQDAIEGIKVRWRQTYEDCYDALENGLEIKEVEVTLDFNF